MSDDYIDQTEVIEDTKFCPKCERDKPLSAFHGNRSRPDGKQIWCALCSSAHSKVYRKTKPKQAKITKLTSVKMSDTQKMQTEANMRALRKLAENHWREFQMLAGIERQRLGVQKKWSSAG